MEPVISIVTITYNAQHCLQRTLDSVKRQTYQHIEHLIIDGASEDDTVGMAERYRADCPYDTIISSEPDSGLYDAMNKGLKRASGDYIVFLNAGDALHAADTLETVVETALQAQLTAESNEAQRLTAESNEADRLPAVVYGDTAITDTEGRFMHLRRLRPPRKLSWLSFCQGMLVCHQAFYARLDIARQFPYDLHYRHSADVDWCIQVMKEADALGLPLANTNAVLADFAEGGNTSQHHHASLLERFRVMRHHYGLLTTLLMHGWFVIRSVIK